MQFFKVHAGTSGFNICTEVEMERLELLTPLLAKAGVSQLSQYPHKLGTRNLPSGSPTTPVAIRLPP